MVGQGHRSDQHEFDPTPGGSGRQEGLACSGPWGHEESDTTKRLNNNNKQQYNIEPFSFCTVRITGERTVNQRGSKRKPWPSAKQGEVVLQCGRGSLRELNQKEPPRGVAFPIPPYEVNGRPHLFGPAMAAQAGGGGNIFPHTSSPTCAAYLSSSCPDLTGFKCKMGEKATHAAYRLPYST